MKKIAIATAIVLSAGVAHAVESPKWDSLSVSYQSVDLNGDKLTGFGFSGTKLVGSDFFVAASYATVSDELEAFGETVDVDLNTLSAGLGYRHSISPSSDFFGIVSYEDVEIEASSQFGSGSASDNGYGLRAGIRTFVADNFELSGSLSYVDIADESETGFNVSAMYYLAEQFSVGVGYSKADDVDGVSLSGNFFF